MCQRLCICNDNRNDSFNYWFITLENKAEWRLLPQGEACVRPQMSNQWFSIFKTVILDSRCSTLFRFLTQRKLCLNILFRFLTVREVCSQSITVKLQHLKTKPSRETRWETSTLCFNFYQIYRQQLLVKCFRRLYRRRSRRGRYLSMIHVQGDGDIIPNIKLTLKRT